VNDLLRHISFFPFRVASPPLPHYNQLPLSCSSLPWDLALTEFFQCQVALFLPFSRRIRTFFPRVPQGWPRMPTTERLEFFLPFLAIGLGFFPKCKSRKSSPSFFDQRAMTCFFFFHVGCFFPFDIRCRFSNFLFFPPVIQDRARFRRAEFFCPSPLMFPFLHFSFRRLPFCLPPPFTRECSCPFWHRLAVFSSTCILILYAHRSLSPPFPAETRPCFPTRSTFFPLPPPHPLAVPFSFFLLRLAVALFVAHSQGFSFRLFCVAMAPSFFPAAGQRRLPAPRYRNFSLHMSFPFF